MGTKRTDRSNPDDTKRVYLFAGEADPRRQSAVDELVERVLDSESAAFDLEELDGYESTAERVLAAANMVPLTSERKVVIVDRADRLSPEDQVSIADFIPKLGEKSCLILLAGEEEQSRRKRSQPQGQKEEDEGKEDADRPKRKRGLQPELVAAAKAHGALVRLPKLRYKAFRPIVDQAVKAAGKKIEPAAAQALAQSLASSPSTLDSETKKLAAFLGERDTITSADVDKVVTKSPEDSIFRLIDAIAAKQQGRAIHLLNETFAASAKPDNEVPRLLAMMARHFRMLYQAKFLKTQGVKHLGSVPEELESVLTKKHNPVSLPDFAQRDLLQQADSFTLEEIRQCLKRVLACELEVKGLGRGGASPRLNLEMLVLRLSRRRRKRGRKT